MQACEYTVCEYTVGKKAHMPPIGNLDDLAELSLEDNRLKELPFEL
jgi:Leucine-rich repeat (LRR) protein